MRSATVSACFLLLAATLFATTAPDLRSRITIDGLVEDYQPDEWITEGGSGCIEPFDDSVWGNDDDIGGLAVTWDAGYLYVAVSARLSGAVLMLLIDSDCGGPEELINMDHFRRNIRFADFTPNVLAGARPVYPFASILAVGCGQPPDLLDEDRFEAALIPDAVEAGAFELALPWPELGRYQREGNQVRLPETGARLKLLAVLTGGEGSGAGDAAPSPSTIPSDSTQTALLDHCITISLDGDGDGLLDLDVSPRDRASCSGGYSSFKTACPPYEIALGTKVFSPEQGEILEFSPSLRGWDKSFIAYLTARVFSVSGELIRVIYEDREWIYFSPSSPQYPLAAWDGRDNTGRLVPGGIYVMVLSAGRLKGSIDDTVKASVAVIR